MRDDTTGHRLVEAEGVTDRKGELTDFELRRAADRERWRQRACIPCPKHCQIVVRRRADDGRARDLARRKTDGDLTCALHYMVVGDDVAVIVPHKSSAGCPAPFTFLAEWIGGRLRRYLHD